MTDALEALRTDTEAWDAFVEASPNGAYTQLSAWADVKRPNGWRAVRIAVDGRSGPLGLQLLIRDLRPTPWRVGYAPRGPVGPGVDAAGVAAMTKALRDLARRERLVNVLVDPEVERGDPLDALLEEHGWRSASSIQTTRTRVVDLDCPEDELWGDLRKKWRQYVSKARRDGVLVEDVGGAGLDVFYRIYVETAQRAGFIHRARRAYDEVFAAYERGGRARLLLARLPDGSPVATLMLLRCGRRVIEPYGGMTEAGAASRANYLLKWEAIRSSREQGAAVYDMWGLSHPGIAHFKAGFGGREVDYIGGRSLVVDRLGSAAVDVVRRVGVAVARRRHRARGVAVSGGDGDGA